MVYGGATSLYTHTLACTHIPQWVNILQEKDDSISSLCPNTVVSVARLQSSHEGGGETKTKKTPQKTKPPWKRRMLYTEVHAVTKEFSKNL